MSDDLLLAVQKTTATKPPQEALQQVLALVGQYLTAHRCFLYVRNPVAGRGRIALCWRRHASFPNPIHDWQDDTTDLPQQDPLFRAALAARPSVFVEDVETAPPTVLNRAFEHKTFGHRALVHAHITECDTLWGILQPCVFGAPRLWTASERDTIESILPLLVPVVQAYMRAADVQQPSKLTEPLET